MTLITVTVNDMNGLGGRVPIAGPAYLEIQPNQAWVDSDGILTTRTLSVPIVAGVASVEVTPTSAGRYYRILLRNVSGLFRPWTVTVPDLPQVSLATLIQEYQVDPATVPGASQPDPAWVADLEDVKASIAAVEQDISVVLRGDGIDPTGVTDSTAAIQAKLDALPPFARVTIPAGTFRISSLMFNSVMTFVGCGGSIGGDGELSPERAVTTLVSTSPTADALTFTAAGVTLRDFALVNNSTTPPTGGRGILLTKASQAYIEGVTVLGFWDNVEARGVYWSMHACHLYDPVHYGLHVNNQGAAYVDHGDFGITGNIISAMYREYEAVAAVQWESGGGIRFVGNKINAAAQPGNGATRRFQYGLRFDARDDTATGDLVITGNSIANCSVALVRITQTGDGYFGYFNITGNQINVGDDTCVGVHVGAGDEAHLQNIVDGLIADNVFHDFPGSSIVVDWAMNVNIGENVHKNVGTNGSPVVRLGTGVQSATPIGASVASQAVRGDNITILEDWRTHGNDSPRQGTMAHDYQRAWHETVAGNDQAMYRIGVMQNGAALVTVRVTGTNWDTNRQFTIEETKYLWRSWSNSVTHETVGVPIAAGVAADMQITYDTVTYPGQVVILVRSTNPAWPNVDAEVQVTAQGGVQIVHKGA